MEKEEAPTSRGLFLRETMSAKHSPTRCYYVDEAGDSTIYGRGGKSLLGTDGVSKYFILGFLDVHNPEQLSADLNTLRQNLVADPYFGGIPSMQADYQKTALFLHAKDDLAEVRYEVFKLLRQQSGLKFYAVVRTKAEVIAEYQRLGQKYNPNNLYDEMARQLFRQHLHKGNEFRVCFAKRGNADRTSALKLALENSRRDAEDRWGVKTSAPLLVSAVNPISEVCLQATDYLLWALQRCYERREDRYLNSVEHLYHLVLDQDDKRKKPYGVYYNCRRNPIRLSKLP